VLNETGREMTCPELIEAMAAKRYWTGGTQTWDFAAQIDEVSLYLFGTPLALDSYWGLVPIAAMVAWESYRDESAAECPLIFVHVLGAIRPSSAPGHDPW
jgi:hypothetical protein